MKFNFNLGKKEYNLEGEIVKTEGFSSNMDMSETRVHLGEGRILYTGDTGPGLSYLWEDMSPQLLIIDTTYPNRLTKMADEAGHMCPEMLKSELIQFLRIKRYLPKVFVIHISPQFEQEIEREIQEIGKELEIVINIAHEGEEIIL